MRSIVLALVLVSAACMQQHGGADVGNLDCASCHMDLYNAQPDHPGQKPTTCADCHNTSSWGAAHPESAFPIASGAHAGIACNQCHDSSLGSPAKGANTNCIQCHPSTQTDPEHQGVSGYAYDSSMPHFCLTCHPDGKASGHPESPFPIKTGNHVGIACDKCHKASLGSSYSSNFDCYAGGACHSVNHNGTSSSPRACFQCHPTGSAGDGGGG